MAEILVHECLQTEEALWGPGTPFVILDHELLGQSSVTTPGKEPGVLGMLAKCSATEPHRSALQDPL